MDKKRVLVADDRQDVLSMLRDFLISKGFEVKTSQNSKELVKSIKEFHPHLILLDILMPDLDGFEICQMLNDDPETQSIPIIIMSGLSDLLNIKKAYTLGVVGYFTKPFDLNLMAVEINKAIANKENAN